MDVAGVFAEIGMSLDGYVAGANAGPGNPLGDGGAAILDWMYNLAGWRERLGLGGGGSGPDDDLVRGSFERAGAYVMGRRTFDEGEAVWPANPPFRAPVFVVTHEEREAWVREGGTTFTFVTAGVEHAVARARAVAGRRDVRVSGGADVIRQCLRAGLLDELHIHLTPVVLGCGIRLFEGLRGHEVSLESREVTPSWHVTHLSYAVTSATG